MEATFQAERAALSRLVASETFTRAPRLAKILTYVCEQYFIGAPEQIKEYNIGVEALGRPASFNQKEDSIVRVEVHHLRKRLKQYYLSEGAGDQLRIEIPQGQYVPRFVENIPDTELAPAPPGPIEPIRRFPVNAAIEISHETPRPPFALPAPAGRRSRPRWFLPVTAAVVLIAGFLIVRSNRVIAHAPDPAKTAASKSPLAEEDEIRILCGSTAPRQVDRLGNTWGPDRYFTGGGVGIAADRQIADLHGPCIYKSFRFGSFQYSIPLKPGAYELHLFFAENNYGDDNVGGGGETSRIFDVIANGKPLLSDMDVIADAGGANLPDERIFKDIGPANDGMLHLDFAGKRDAALVYGIELLPTVAGKARPIRIVARDTAYTDKEGRLWGRDRYYHGGRILVRPESPANTTDPELFSGERYGNLVYTIPAAPGKYSLVLRFAEFWFGPTRPGGGGPGSRLFNIYCNGYLLAKNLDIEREAGCCYRAIAKTFNGIVPNPQGKVMVSMEPVANYAFINALELLDSSQ